VLEFTQFGAFAGHSDFLLHMMYEPLPEHVAEHSVSVAFCRNWC
jgi:hypothetical protein